MRVSGSGPGSTTSPASAATGLTTGCTLPAHGRARGSPPRPPERRAWGEIHEQAEAGITAGNAHAISTPPTVRPDARRRAQCHEACATSVGKPRSTPQRVCFMTSSDVTTTSVAGEVKLYLAVMKAQPLPAHTHYCVRGHAPLSCGALPKVRVRSSLRGEL